MIQDKAKRSLSAACFGLVACGAFAACAGSDRPEPSDEQAAQIAAVYVNGATGVAGRGGAGGAGGGSGGSAQSSGGAAGGSGAGECDAFAILRTSCSGQACHGAGSDLGNFAESLEIAESFVGLDPLANGACAQDGPVIDTENPRQSLLVQKVNGAAPCGLDMPLGPAPLTDDEVDCLVEWIGTL